MNFVVLLVETMTSVVSTDICIVDCDVYSKLVDPSDAENPFIPVPILIKAI